jgi:hypothetical protein
MQIPLADNHTAVDQGILVRRVWLVVVLRLSRRLDPVAIPSDGIAFLTDEPIEFKYIVVVVDFFHTVNEEGWH